MPLHSDLKSKFVHGVSWSALEALSRHLLQFTFSIFLARLLSPDEFGVIAILSLLIAVASVFADCGFGSALIQRENPSQIEKSSVFFFNMLVGAGAALVLTCSAPHIARFYNLPSLGPMLKVMAWILFISSLGTVQRTLLVKSLEFKTLMRITFVSSLASGTFGVFLAWRGWGAWSLVVQALSAASLSTILVWCRRSWMPSLAFELRALLSLFRFSSYIFLATLIDAVFSRLHTLVIGKFYSMTDLGFYNRADTTRQLPNSLLATVVDRVSFPLFSSISSNIEMLRNGVRRSLTSTMFVNIPVFLGLAVVARPAVHLLYGEKWLPCVPYLQLLCIATVLWPMHVTNLSALKAMGRSDLFFRVEIFKKCLSLTVLLLVAPISILAITWSAILMGVVSSFINAYFVGQLLGYSWVRQMRDLLPSLFCGSIMALTVGAIGYIPSLSPGALLAIQVPVGVAIYASLSGWLCVPAFSEALGLIKIGLARMQPA